jgi:hypothetical protein
MLPGLVHGFKLTHSIDALDDRLSWTLINSPGVFTYLHRESLRESICGEVILYAPSYTHVRIYTSIDLTNDETRKRKNTNGLPVTGVRPHLRSMRPRRRSLECDHGARVVQDACIIGTFHLILFVVSSFLGSALLATLSGYQFKALQPTRLCKAVVQGQPLHGPAGCIPIESYDLLHMSDPTGAPPAQSSDRRHGPLCSHWCHGP